MAGGPGFEPRLTESESAVLPLNYPPSERAWERRLDNEGAGAAQEARRGGARTALIGAQPISLGIGALAAACRPAGGASRRSGSLRRPAPARSRREARFHVVAENSRRPRRRPDRRHQPVAGRRRAGGAQIRDVERVYGAAYGVRGIVNEDFVDLGRETEPQSGSGRRDARPRRWARPATSRICKYCQEILKVLKAHEIGQFPLYRRQ